MFLKRYKSLYKFKPYFLKYKNTTILLVISMFIASSFGMVLAYLLSEQLVAISNIHINNIVKFTVLILAGISIHHIAWFFWGKLSSIIGNKVAKDIRHDAMRAVLNTKYQHIKDKNSGFYLERLNDDIYSVSFFMQEIAGSIVDILTNVSFLVVICFLNWQCGLIFAIGLVGLYLIDLLKIKIELKYTKQQKILKEQINSNVTEAFKGIKEIKGLGIKSEILKSNDNLNDNLSKLNIKMTNYTTLLQRLSTFSQWLIDAILVFVCAFWLFPTNQITVVVLLIIFNYKSLMYDTITLFSKIKEQYVQGEFKAERILNILNEEKEAFGTNEISKNDNALAVKNLSYNYNNRQILKDISFCLKKNTATVLIGASGSGKTTLFNLITKLYDVESNKIFINGQDINTINEKSFRTDVSIVTQEPFLLNDSIINNLKIVKPNATIKEIQNACKIANLHDEIVKMENGYDTIILENGTNFSGGQKQRLSIARNILKNTPIILFDEPTSALDNNNQTKIFNLINQLKTHKTIFVISHNLNNLSAFDNIFELKNKQINILK